MTEVIYKDLSAENDEAPMELESVCVNCQENGITKLMCTRIPFYKQVILMSFSCDHCGYRNNELQSGEPVQEFGTEIVLHVKEQSDLNRTVVKSEYASLAVPELELEVPFKSQPGEVTTVEGVLRRVVEGLSQDQILRRIQDPEGAKQIDDYISRVEDYISLKKEWTLKLNDPSGNCFIQNPSPMHVDPKCITSHYYRDIEANKLLALADDDDKDVEWKPTTDDIEWKSYEDCKNTIMHFNSQCPNCKTNLEVLMKPTDIPYFQTVIVMSSSCDKCGFKSNEVQAGGAIQEQGCKLSIKVEKDVDLARDVLKSDTCGLAIPELDVEIGMGALSGRFTTVEGLLQAIKEQLDEQSSFFFGDSGSDDVKGKFENIFRQMDQIITLQKPATLILDDPAGNSYIQSLTDEGEDPRLTKEFYTRSYEQNDELGLNDMKVENYEGMDTIKEEEE
ncbi:unnamed protein product [Bursaphelenchus okinawaensis]|uniref:Zinc finger ZPR1-type domain-containing protein n=1 Tax=Bursaphelenchus okinawaensis TaxID=465554 RepID=A0A811LCI0_9BILA|nr:unnamed protein product [Bursaphelenchus okinawaensis]CAG9120184.1 unnamed protein product [Bursaphelenchus okinawaensis]